VFEVRPFKPGDLDACYAISLATGFEGRDAAHLYRDPEMMGHIYVAPYVRLEPALAFVIEDADGVAGFAVGAVDTIAWEDRLGREWWPALRERYADPAGVPPENRTPDQRRAFMIHHPVQTPRAVTGKYPAHLHVNLLPRVQRRGLGAKLLELWLATAGNPSTHVGVNRANRGAVAFWTAHRFHELGLADRPTGRTFWMGRVPLSEGQ
jgi:GNAT superfamily N-acetyltransferase